MKKTLALLLAAVLLTAVLAACGGSASSTAASAPSAAGSTSAAPASTAPAADVAQDFIYAVDTEPSGLDPHKATAHASLRVHKNIYNRLTLLEADLSISPELATEWVYDAAANTYTFTLNQGVKFHNGREMVAEDVVYSYNRILDPETASPAANYFTNVESVEATDDYTVVFHLSGPDATFLAYTANPYCAIVPQEVVEENGDLQNVTCGTGPFMLKEYIEGNQIVLEKNPDYFVEGQPKLDSLTYVLMADESARLNALRTGAVHLAKMTSTSLSLAEGNDEIVVMDYLSANYDFLGFNLDEGPCADVRVRQALSMIVDRQEIIDTIYDGYAEVTGPVVVAMEKWAIDVKTNPYYQHDVAAGQALLEEAGYPDGFDLEITAGITPLTADVAQVLKAQFDRAGINTTVVVKESSAAIDDWRNRTHQSLISSNGGGNDPDRGVGFFFKTDSSVNVWGYSNADIDRLAAEGKSEMDEAARKAIYDEAQEILIEEVPNLFLVSPSEFYFARNNVQGFVAQTYCYDWFADVSLG